MRTLILVSIGFMLGVAWQTLAGQRRRRSGTVNVQRGDVISVAEHNPDWCGCDADILCLCPCQECREYHTDPDDPRSS